MMTSGSVDSKAEYCDSGCQWQQYSVCSNSSGACSIFDHFSNVSNALSADDIHTATNDSDGVSIKGCE